MKSSLEKYKIIFDTSVSAILFSTPDGTILEVNKTAEEMFGYTFEEFVRLGRNDIVDHSKGNIEQLIQERKEIGSIKAELIGIRKNGERFPVKLSSTAFTDDDGAQYICTSMQDISIRKKSEQEMALMIENTEESFILLDANLNVVSFNKQFEDLGKKYFGFEVEKGTSIFDYAQPERKKDLKEMYARVLNGATEKSNITLPIVDGIIRYFKLTYSPAKDETDTIIGVFVSARDVTEETESQLAIKEIKANLEKILDFSLDVICSIDEEGYFVNVSHASEKVWGYTPEELIGKKYIDYVFPDDIEKTKIASLEIIAGFDQTNFQNRNIKKDGTIVPIIWSAKWDDTEKMMFCVAKDGTEKVKREEALVESEKLYKNLFENSPAPMFIFDFETLQIIDCNEETLLKYGYTKEEFLQLTIKDIRPPEDIEKIEQATADEAAYGQIHKNIWRHQKKNGDIMFMDISGHLMTYNGRRVSLVMLIDVTEKLKNEELKEFEKRDKEALINSTDDLIWSVSEKYKLIAANQAFINTIQEQIGITVKAGDSLLIEDAFPSENLDFWKLCYSKSLAGVAIKEEAKSFSVLNNREIWYDISFNPIYKEEEVVGIACYAKNITESKKALSILKDREAKLSSAQEIAKLGYWHRDIATEVLFWSSEVYKIWGVNKNVKPNFKLFTSTIHPNDIDLFMEEQLATINGIKEMDIEHRIILEDGSIKWVHEKGKWQKDNEGKIISLAGTVQDITERKKNEEKLKESIQRYENVTKATSDAIWDWDLVNNVTYRAEGFRTSFGYDLEKLNAPDSEWEDYIHPDDKHLAVKSITDIINTNESYWKHEYRIIKSNGQAALIQDSAYLIRDENNKVIRIIGALKDISESKYYHNLEILEREILELNALGNIPLNQVIEKYMLGIEKLHTGMLCSMQERKGEQLFNMASPSLPQPYLEAIRGIKIGDNVGSCGTAAFLGKKVIVTDIANDFRWANYKDVAASHGLIACCSTPILNSEGKVLATFASYYQEVKSPTPLEENTIDRACHILQVILESYLNEKALKESNVRYENVTKATSDAIWDWDLESKKVFWGEPFSILFGNMGDKGLTDEERVYKRLHPEEVEQVLQSTRAVIKSKDSNWSYEHRYLKANGNYAYVANKALIIRDEKGKATRVIGAMQDITRRKQEELQLKLMSSVVTNTDDAVLITEAEPFNEPGPKIIYINEAFTKMTGYTAEEVIGKTPRILQGPKSDKKELTRLRKALEKWESCEITIVNYKKNGEEFWVNITISPVADEKGLFTHWIATERDVTIRKNEELQNELIADISTVFNESEKLHETLDRTLGLITNFGGFCFAEAWISGSQKNILLKVSTHSKTQNMKLFLEERNTIETTAKGEGFVGFVAETKEIVIWGDLANQKLLRRRETILKYGVKTLIGLPLVSKNEVIGVLAFGLDYDVSNCAKYISLFQSLSNYLSPEIKRKQLEQELNQLFNFAPDLIVIVGLDGYFKRINPVVSELLGYTEAELYTVPYTNFVHPEDKEKYRTELESLIDTKHTNYFEIRNITKSGKIKWLAWNAIYITEENNIYAVAKDITEKKELEELLQKANELARIGGWEVDIRNDTVFWSDITKEIHEVEPDYKPDLKTGVNFYKKGISRNKINKYIRQGFKTGKSWDDEFQIITGKGNERWVRVIGEVELVNGKYNRIYGSFQDIDERKKAESKLIENENYLRTILDTVPECVKVLNSKGALLYMNPAGLAIIEADNEQQVLGQRMTNLVNKKYKLGFNRLTKEVFKGNSGTLEFEITGLKGSHRWMETHAVPLKDTTGKIVNFLGATRDITVRKKADEEIKNTEERRKLIMNAALDAIICIDKKGLITFWNPQAEKIFGWSEKEVMGKVLSGIIIPETYRAMHDNGMKNYFKTGKGAALNVILQLSALRKGGEEFPIELTVLPILQDGEEFFCAFIRDISERKTYETRLVELNESLKKQKEELVVSNHELEQFAYIASHDLQEPLRMVTSFLTLLNKKYGANFDETATNYVDFAIDGAKRMRQLILDLLEYSRIGKNEEINEFIDLNTLIAEIEILHRKQIEEMNANIIITESLPQIKSHKSPLLQVFQNLISNALKYSRNDSTPVVKISFTSVTDYWQFVVEDNGIGIDEEYFDKIFVIFQRLHNRDEYSGTGMGLAVTKKIVESLGGTIWLDSTVNVGSKFYFTVPKKLT